MKLGPVIVTQLLVGFVSEPSPRVKTWALMAPQRSMIPSEVANELVGALTVTEAVAPLTTI